MGGGVLEGGVEDLLRGDGVAEGVAVVVELDGDGGGGDAIGVVFWGKGAGGERCDDELGCLCALCFGGRHEVGTYFGGPGSRRVMLKCGLRVEG